ncbi:Methyltransferase type 11 [Lasiodiplodia theobromae]|uniref:Methyltransferase type 11 n=1 Tax=Lasiodiplodia theobromae TaxID=45133 RepID=UPI0015C2F6F0|nr:Methyltransferase type 11 [Lasiodiplodia theobromae]KAF4534634.1 Methyltransferase type 11 [Lasiodiplodia theobromae]
MEYKTSASFVPQLTTTVLSYLSPEPTDHILDIGCGDGPLTEHIASLVPQGSVLGLDASPSMIKTAQEEHSSLPNISFQVADCADLPTSAPDLLASARTAPRFTKIFSNAAFHWILRSPHSRTNPTVFSHLCTLLRPGGRLVLEAGGAGNVAEVYTALTAALVTHGGVASVAAAREASPWYFADEGWMRDALAEAGFEVERVEKEYRPTRLTTDEGGGVEGWVRLFGKQFLEAVQGADEQEREKRREDVVKWVVEAMRSSCEREDGSWWLGYVRLRAVARKPSAA